MVSFHRIAGLAASAALLASPAAALAGDFVDTRITFLFTDDDVLHGPGETQPSSPSARIGGGRNSTLFFDNYDTKYTGFETLSNLVLYKKDSSYFRNLETEAALALTLLAASPEQITFQDASSYVRLTYRPDSWNEYEGLSLTAFPVSADRFRLGYSYRLSWAGNRIFPRVNRNEPNGGMKIQLTRGPFYFFAGLKTALILNELTNERETNYGGLFGGGWDITKNLRWEANGGIFQRGVLVRMDGEPITAGGVSSQLTWHVGMPIGTSVDFKLYKNDPEVYQRFFQPETYEGGLSYSVSVEGTWLTQNVIDPDKLASTTRQDARAGDIQARVKFDKTRLHLTASYRDLAFILFNVPSLVPFQDFPADAEVEPEFFIAGGADYYFESLRLTPGIVAGVQFPASITTELGRNSGTNPAPTSMGRRTTVVREEGQFVILPEGADVQPIVSVKGTMRLDLSDSMSAAGEVYYTRDPNRATIADNRGGNQQVRVFEDPDALGFNLLLQARF